MAVVSEWLRRYTRNLQGSARTGSNPVDRASFFSLVIFFRSEDSLSSSSLHHFTRNNGEGRLLRCLRGPDGPLLRPCSLANLKLVVSERMFINEARSMPVAGLCRNDARRHLGTHSHVFPSDYFSHGTVMVLFLNYIALSSPCVSSHGHPR